MAQSSLVLSSLPIPMAQSSLVAQVHPSSLQKEIHIPKQFIWPKDERIPAKAELIEPVIDLAGLFKGDAAAIAAAAEQTRALCEKHGFFQVINHGVDEELIRAVHDEMDTIFNLPVEIKEKITKRQGSMWGYSGGHSNRFQRQLVWKEMLTFEYAHDSTPEEHVIVDYFKNNVGKEYEKTGLVYQKYCEAMKNLSNVIFELLAISLGLDRELYKKFFENAFSLMRCNYYPACNEPELTIGTNPHCDPTSLTILSQDQIGGLDVFTDNKWLTIPPHPNALVINIGDTLMALTNGRYKSCLHRAMVHKGVIRKSLPFFVSPKKDKIVKPANELVERDGGIRKYPDFTWGEFLEFTQTQHRVDATTLDCFCSRLLSNKN